MCRETMNHVYARKACEGWWEKSAAWPFQRAKFICAMYINQSSSPRSLHLIIIISKSLSYVEIDPQWSICMSQIGSNWAIFISKQILKKSKEISNQNIATMKETNPGSKLYMKKWNQPIQPLVMNVMGMKTMFLMSSQMNQWTRTNRRWKSLTLVPTVMNRCLKLSGIRRRRPKFELQ